MKKLKNFVTPLHQRTKRNYTKRMMDDKVNCALIAKNMIKNIDNWKNVPLWDEKSIKSATKVWFKYMKNKEIGISRSNFTISKTNFIKNN